MSSSTTVGLDIKSDPNAQQRYPPQHNHTGTGTSTATHQIQLQPSYHISRKNESFGDDDVDASTSSIGGTGAAGGGGDDSSGYHHDQHHHAGAGLDSSRHDDPDYSLLDHEDLDPSLLSGHTDDHGAGMNGGRDDETGGQEDGTTASRPPVSTNSSGTGAAGGGKSKAGGTGGGGTKRKKKDEDMIVDPEAGVLLRGESRGRKKDDTLPPSRARDVQRAFRARRAAHLAKLEDRILELEVENNRLRSLMALPTIGRDDLGSGPTGRGKSLKEGGVPMAERVKAKKERDRLRAQQAARARGINPPSNEEVDKAHGHELLGDFLDGDETPDEDDLSGRRDLTRTPETGSSLRLGTRSPSFGGMMTPGTNVSLGGGGAGGTPLLGGPLDHSAVSMLGALHGGVNKLGHFSTPGNNTPSGSNNGGNQLGNNGNMNVSQVQADLHRLYQQALLASQLSAATNNPNGNSNGGGNNNNNPGAGQQNNWSSPQLGMNQHNSNNNGYSTIPTGHNLTTSSGSTPPAGLPDLIALLTGITNQGNPTRNNAQNGFVDQHLGGGNGNAGQGQGGSQQHQQQQGGPMSNMSLPMPFPASNAPSFPSAPQGIPNNGFGQGPSFNTHGPGVGNNGNNQTHGNNNNGGNGNQNGPNDNNAFGNFSFEPPHSAPPHFQSFNIHGSPPPPNQSIPHLGSSNNPNNQLRNVNQMPGPGRGGSLGLRASSFGNASGIGSRSPGDMRPPPPPGEASMPSRPHSSTGGHGNALGLDADRQRIRSESVGRTQQHMQQQIQQHQQQQQQQQQPANALEGGDRAEPDLLHRLRHCCHLTDHHVATDPGLLLFASRLCLAVGCPFSGNHSDNDGIERPDDGGGKRRRMDLLGQDDESENPEGYMKLEAAWSALRSHLDPSSDQNPLLGIPGLGGGERDGQNAIATGRLAAEMVLRGARSKMSASAQGGPGGSQDPIAINLSYWIGCRRRSGLVIERSVVDVITMAF